MTLDIRIDGDRALDLLHNRVQGNEDFVYTKFETAPTCRYEANDCPSCLIGCALFDAGVPVEHLRAMDILPTPTDPTDAGYSWALDSGVGIEEVKLPAGLVITTKAKAVFARAQGAQDVGFTWGEAFRVAHEEANLFGPERDDFERRA